MDQFGFRNRNYLLYIYFFCTYFRCDRNFKSNGFSQYLGARVSCCLKGKCYLKNNNKKKTKSTLTVTSTLVHKRVPIGYTRHNLFVNEGKCGIVSEEKR